jgi:hypothetical protein
MFWHVLLAVLLSLIVVLGIGIALLTTRVGAQHDKDFEADDEGFILAPHVPTSGFDDL